MQWFQAILKRDHPHKYAINSKLLGDHAEIAWSNLGYWDVENVSYPQACHRLAQHLADTIHLNSNDILLDLGCGQGASLALWKEHYQLKHIEAVELQETCVRSIQNKLDYVHKIHCNSFLNLKAEHFDCKFDAILCIDAAYHSNLNSFLEVVAQILNSEGRLAFHYLVLTEKFQHLNAIEKLKLKYLLKYADVKCEYLFNLEQTTQILEQRGFKQVHIENLSEHVLVGFAEYIQQQKIISKAKISLDQLKINMTAKLCQKLYTDGLVDYVQISVIKE